MKLRTLSRLVIAAVVLGGIAVAAVYGTSAKGPPPPPPLSAGTALSERAPAISLVDQNGRRVTLAGQHGHWVIVAFFYTHCPDICPMTAQKLRTVLRRMGSEGQNIRVLIVSTDPFGDTRFTAKRWLAKNGSPRWRYLVGSYHQLAQVWNGYHIYVAPPTKGKRGNQAHQAYFYLIDPRGHYRELLRDQAPAPNISQDFHVDLDDHLWKTSVVGAAVGEMAPNFSLPALRKGDVRLSGFRGKDVILNFWATWCVPCKSEMPLLERIFSRHSHHLVVIGIDQQEPKDEVAAYTRQVGTTYPVALDGDGNVAYAYDVSGTPTSFFVNRSGVIERIDRGALNKATVASQVRALLNS